MQINSIFNEFENLSVEKMTLSTALGIFSTERFSNPLNIFNINIYNIGSLNLTTKILQTKKFIKNNNDLDVT